MPTDNRTIAFEDLADADLYVGAVYLGGSQGTAADDPLAKLLPVGNQGGFRHAGSPTKGTVRLSVLYTSGAEAEWPDALDPETGVFTYFGDNRKPGRDLLKTTRGGNILLRNAFEASRGAREDRLSVPPFLLFEKAGIGRAVRFLGLLVPCEPTPDAEDVPTVVRHTVSGQEFENYRARFTVLDTEVVPRSWLTSVLDGADTTNAECPGAWRDWVGEETASAPGASARALGFASTSPSSAEENLARAVADNVDGAGADLSDRDGSERSPGADRVAPTAAADTAAGHDLAAGLSLARVTAIAPEIRATETLERDHLGPVQAERRESALQERYLRFLEGQGHTVCRQMIVVPGESSALYTDVFDVTTGELVEVKADSGRTTIRAALGQVLDYARYVPHTSKAVLVPGEPGADLVDLLLRFGVAVVWEEASGGFRRLDPDCRREAVASAI